MTAVKRFAVFALVAAASAALAQQPQQQRQSPAEWERLHQMGLKYRSASDLYMALKSAAGGGKVSPPYAQLPDWSGLWIASGGGSFTGPAPGGSIPPKLTPAAAAAVKAGQEAEAKGISYDENLSECGPPGYPRWLVIPFLREFIVRPEEVWLTSETVNNVRRIYTDGREHPPEAERYPLYYGDSIGFWDGQKLVIHTNSLMGRSMGRGQPNQSDKMETVEVWNKIDARTISVDAWIFDPALYTETWYMNRRYTTVDNADKSLRINYWHCGENPNNDVFKTPDGSTQYNDFQFGTPKEQGR